MTVDNEPVAVDVEELTRETANAVAHRAGRAESDGESFDEADRRQYALGFVARRLNEITRDRIGEGHPGPSTVERERVTGDVVRRVFSLLPGLEPYLRDPRVTDIYLNGWDDVRLELDDGTLMRGRPFLRSDEELIEWIQLIGRRAGREKPFNRAAPELRTVLPDGSRFAAVAWVSARPYVAIRCHRLIDAGLDELRERSMFDENVEALLTAAVRARLNIMVAGDYGVGKTTLMRALLHAGCEPDERIVVLEEEPELHLAESGRHNHVLSFLTRGPNTEGQGIYRYGDLSRIVKWFKARRVVVGEVQGPEVVDMMEIVTAGRGGAICTIHADSSAVVFERLPVYARIGGQSAWKTSDIKELAAASIRLVVYLDQATDGRRVVAEIRQVTGYDPMHEQVLTNAIFVPGPDGRAVANPSAPMSERLRARLAAHGYTATGRVLGPQVRFNGEHGGRR